MFLPPFLSVTPLASSETMPHGDSISSGHTLTCKLKVKMPNSVLRAIYPTRDLSPKMPAPLGV